MADITLYTCKRGPNGWKVAILLEELGISYNSVFLDIAAGEQKQPNFTKINPNGRIPAIVDHKNNDFIVWESAAILYYLAQKYDTEHRVIPAKFEDQIEVLTWVSFQISGLGPYVGQLAWFQNYHKEKIPSAIERYHNEAKRLFSVIEGHLQGKEYVNGTYSISDIAFFPWFRVSHYVGFDKETDEFKNEYPNTYTWYHRVATRPAVVKAYEQSD